MHFKFKNVHYLQHEIGIICTIVNHTKPKVLIDYSLAIVGDRLWGGDYNTGHVAGLLVSLRQQLSDRYRDHTNELNC